MNNIFLTFGVVLDQNGGYTPAKNKTEMRPVTETTTGAEPPVPRRIVFDREVQEQYSENKPR